MTSLYTILNHTVLAPDAVLSRPTFSNQKVTMESPAVAVMTDLERVMAITIGPGASIEAANKYMIAAGVRLLLVLDHEQRIVGLISASDILGEKPLQHLQRTGGTFEEVLVSHVMTPQDELDVLLFRDVRHARVGDIVATLKYFGRQHVLVMDKGSSDVRQRLRGIFSATQIGRQLGMNVAPGEIATTFAQLESALVS